MTEAEIAAVAGRLSEAQINLLWMWPKGLFDQATRRVLVKRGLIDGRSVTPLGLAVRAHLQSTPIGDEG